MSLEDVNDCDLYKDQYQALQEQANKFSIQVSDKEEVAPCRQGSQLLLPPEQSTELNLLTLSSCQPRNQPALACRGFSSTERRRCRLQWKERWREY